MYRRVIVTVAFALLSATLLTGVISSAALAKGKAKVQHKSSNPPQLLNLSGIFCTTDGKVEVEFIVVNLPDGVTPLDLTFTMTHNGGKTITLATYSKHTGNAYHYIFLGNNGYYDVTGGTVNLSNGTSLTLHNPDSYSGTYNCGQGGCQGSASCSGWTFTFNHRLDEQATVTVYAKINGKWTQAGSGVINPSKDPSSTISGGWTITMPTTQTDIAFTAQYDGSSYTVYAVRAACSAAP